MIFAFTYPFVTTQWGPDYIDHTGELFPIPHAVITGRSLRLLKSYAGDIMVLAVVVAGSTFNNNRSTSSCTNRTKNNYNLLLLYIINKFFRRDFQVFDFLILCTMFNLTSHPHTILLGIIII